MGKRKGEDKDHSRHYEIAREWVEDYLLRSGATGVRHMSDNFLLDEQGHGVHLYTRWLDERNNPYRKSGLEKFDYKKDKETFRCKSVEAVLVRTYERAGEYQKGLRYLVRVPWHCVEKGDIDIQFKPEQMNKEYEYIPLDPEQFTKQTMNVTLSPEEEAFVSEIERGTGDLSDTEREG